VQGYILFDEGMEKEREPLVCNLRGKRWSDIKKVMLGRQT
jgi:hypothetical protein